MNKAAFILAVFASVVLLAIGGCAPGASATVRGSGQVSSESRPVGHFTEIELAGQGNVIVQQTGSESLNVEAEDNLLPLLTSKVEGDRLVLGVRANANLAATKPIVYHVTVKDLTAVQVSGSGNIKANDIHAEKMTVRISGSGNVELSGRATTQNVDISGSGDYSAAALDSTDATVHVSGSGSVVVKADGHLDAHISGSGSVEYEGSPTVTSHVSGSGRIRQRRG